MKILLAGASLLALAGCGSGSSAVGENSADSIRTTAVGNVVGAIPSPTPAADSSAMSSNIAADSGAMSNDAATANAM